MRKKTTTYNFTPELSPWKGFNLLREASWLRQEEKEEGKPLVSKLQLSDEASTEATNRFDLLYDVCKVPVDVRVGKFTPQIARYMMWN